MAPALAPNSYQSTKDGRPAAVDEPNHNQELEVEPVVGKEDAIPLVRLLCGLQGRLGGLQGHLGDGLDGESRMDPPNAVPLGRGELQRIIQASLDLLDVDVEDDYD
jgi:hypothetical protein